MENEHHILLSIVTVCYNSEHEIGKTIESVLGLNYRNIEYIFIDGLSKDSTLEIIHSYYPQLKERGIIFNTISEKDSGIYDAMNKGLKHANGDSIIFMNAGDVFAPEFDLNSLVNKHDLDTDIVIGFSIQTYKGDSFLRPDKLKIQHLIDYPAHQAIFVPKKCYKKVSFRQNLKIAADYYWIKEVLKLTEYKIEENIISIFSLGGKSTSKDFGDIYQMFKEMNMKFCLAKTVIKFLLFRVLGRKYSFRLIYRNIYTRL